jgi:hypothetical protein
MRNQGKSVVTFAGAGALAMLLATSAFADAAPRFDRQRNDARSDSRSAGTYRGGSNRGDQRIAQTGRIRSFTRDGDGYRVQLDRDDRWYRVPSGRLGNRGRDLRVGISISLGGIFRGGAIEVDNVGWPGDSGYGRYDQRYDQGYIRGVVDRVDFRRGTALMRDDASGRIVEVDLSRAGRSSRIGLDDLRRGDYITVEGDWLRGGAFIASRIDSVDTRRY